MTVLRPSGPRRRAKSQLFDRVIVRSAGRRPGPRGVVGLFHRSIGHIVRVTKGRRSRETEKERMTLFSSMRKLVGLALAMLIIATSFQPVHAHLGYGELGGPTLVGNSSSADHHGILDAALYISEESEGQSGRKGPSQRLASDGPAAVDVTVPPTALFSVHHSVPPDRATRAEGGLFLSPLKTGPPSV